MIKYFSIATTIIVAWLIHVVLVTNYLKLFTDSHSLTFRAVYAVELSLTFCIAWGIYLSRSNHPASSVLMIVSTIGFLTVVDLILSLTVPSVRSSFDIWHFVVGYSVLALALAATHKILS